MTNDLSEHKFLIHKLAPIAEKPEFTRLLNEATQELSNEHRFLLKMEIKRLSKPCIRSIDLRMRVNASCKLVTFEGINHYLHAPALEIFEDLIKRYGLYTFGVYEAVINLAEHEALAGSISSSDEGQQDSQQLNNEKYIVDRQSLLDFPHRCEERMNYVVSIEIFFSNNESVFASTIDISPSGLKLKLKEPERLDMMQAFTSVNIIFRGFPIDSRLSKESIEYRILGISGAGEKAKVHLCRERRAGPQLFNHYVDQLIKLHKRKYKVNLDNVVQALEDKTYEQAFASTSPALSIFVDNQNEQKPLAKYACINGTNKEIMDYWLDENDQQNIGFLVNPERLNNLIYKASDDACIWVYSFTHLKDGKVYFYSATMEELNAKPDLRAVFLSYASRKLSWRVYKVMCCNIDPNSGYLPTAMPTGINRKIDRLNRPLAPRLKSKLHSFRYMLSVTDVTHSVAQQCYQKNPLDTEKIKDLATFGHPRNKSPEPVFSFRFKQQEQRKETRYKLRTPIKLENYNASISGVSEDCSVSGLKIELEEPFEQRINSRVSVSFPLLQKKTTQFVLQNLKYRVKHINHDKLVVHLEAISEQELSIAEQFFSVLIEGNKDKLKTVTNEELVPGMSHALRCIQARNSQQLCTYMEKQKGGYFPVKTSVNQTSAPWFNLFKKGMPDGKLNNAWLFQDKNKSNAFVRDALRTLKLERRAIQAEIYVALDPTDLNNETAIVAQWENELATHRSKVQFIKSALAKGEFYAFSVHIAHANRPDTTMLEQELAYLTRYAIHKANQLEEQMWNIAGQIFVTDVSQEALYRYQLKQ